MKLAALLTVAFFLNAQSSPPGAWPNYGNDPGGMRYSPLVQINRGNVSHLQAAWTFHTGDISDGSGGRRRSGFENTPIFVDGVLYVTTPFNRIIALDPATGKQLWAYDPKIDQTWEAGDGLINRGIATWLDRTRPSGKPCHRRLFEATIDARLAAIDAATGLPCVDFGNAGMVSLHDVPNFRPGWYHMTSPPAVIGDIVVVGSAIDDNPRTDMPSGVVRAFNARTGALLWSWDPIGSEKARGGANSKTWNSGAANAWSIMSVDPERRLVFVPTGSASPDYYGGLRPGDDRWANSVVALHAETGKVAWGFQLVHHDLWDYDSASPPLLATIPHAGKPVPVVIQGNKTGFLYVLNRDTGTPIFPVQERPAPKSDVPGESASPTQPIPTAPPPLAPQRASAADAWGLTPEERDACRGQIESLRNEGIFTPPSLKGSLSIPGTIGGMTWSGYALDPRSSSLIVSTNNFPTKVRLYARDEFNTVRRTGEKGEYTAQAGSPYGMFRTPLVSPQYQLPCVPPPWGMLSAVDLTEGKIRWQVPLGSFSPGKVPDGVINLGGPIVTAGGLAFIAGTIDPFFRAFDIDTGKELWKAQLPTSAHATPMTYEVSGKQFVVIAAGGHAKVDTERQDDAVVAFAIAK